MNENRAPMGLVPTVLANSAGARGIKRLLILPPCSVSPEDLERLFKLLQVKALEAAGDQVATIQRQVNQTNEQFEQAKSNVRSWLGLVVRVEGSDGDWTVANTPDPLREDALPLSIASIQYDSCLLFRERTNNSYPQDHFLVTLDFTRTDVFELTNTVDASATHRSSVGVSGTNVTWVNAVTQELRTFFDQRATRRSWLHSRYAYDVLLISLGFPASLNIVYHCDRLLRPILKLPDALFVALYVYLVLVALLVFRFLFNYAKWIFPRLENPIKGHGAPALHKTVIGAIGLALVVRAVTSLLWALGIHLH